MGLNYLDKYFQFPFSLFFLSHDLSFFSFWFEITGENSIQNRANLFEKLIKELFSQAYLVIIP